MFRLESLEISQFVPWIYAFYFSNNAFCLKELPIKKKKRIFLTYNNSYVVVKIKTISSWNIYLILKKFLCWKNSSVILQTKQCLYLIFWKYYCKLIIFLSPRDLPCRIEEHYRHGNRHPGLPRNHSSWSGGILYPHMAVSLHGDQFSGVFNSTD